MKKSLVLVCQQWREAVLPFLYRNVVLRRVGQVVAFARTLQSSSLVVAPLVHSVSFTLFVPNYLRNVGQPKCRERIGALWSTQ